MEHKTGCLLCGSDLRYFSQAKQVTCALCRKIYQGDCECSQGHYICDICHSLSAIEIIAEYCVVSTAENPLESALLLMSHPSIKMHGPEHHFLVPAVLLSAYCNLKREYAYKAHYISKARKRAEKVPGGFCGTHGTCGAAIGAGIFLSVITGATPLSKEEWGQSNLLTSKALSNIAQHGGPRCCKRNTFLAITETSRFLKECFSASLPVEDPLRCTFTGLNKECIREDCPFYYRPV